MTEPLPAEEPEKPPSTDPLRPGAAPTLGERSRQILAERRNAPSEPQSRATYYVPALKSDQPRLLVDGVIMLLHLIVGAFWAIVGAAITMAIVIDRVPLNPRGLVAGLLVIGYGGLCCILALGLASAARWAWPTAFTISIIWIILLLYLALSWSLVALLGLPLAGFFVWGLATRKSAFVDPT